MGILGGFTVIIKWFHQLQSIKISYVYMQVTYLTSTSRTQSSGVGAVSIYTTYSNLTFSIVACTQTGFTGQIMVLVIYHSVRVDNFM